MRAGTLRDALDGDASVASNLHDHLPSGATGSHAQDWAAAAGVPPPKPHATPRPKAKAHAGHTTNRAGNTLCPGFQTGQCKWSASNSPITCYYDESLKHQCSNCLSPKHGSQFDNGQRVVCHVVSRTGGTNKSRSSKKKGGKGGKGGKGSKPQY